MRYVFADCRFDLDDPPAARRRYLEAHIPGAVFLDLDEDLSDTSVQGHGRHPLPSVQRFAAIAGRAGIGPGVTVIAYDDGVLAGAARLWWLLRHFGHEQVAVLEGGLGAWHGPLAAGEEEAPAAAAFVPRERSGDTIVADELAARLGDPALVVLDARSPERWRGEVEPRGARKGRIPGSLNVPYAEPGRSLPALALAPGSEVVCSCGSGVSACVTLLRLHEAGRDDARLYVGSWSDWAHRDLPFETGP